MSNTVPSTNISLKDELHLKWISANGHELIGTSETSGPYKMSDLRGALFTDGSTIASTGPIKISDIKGKHFAQKFNTKDKTIHSTNSAHNTRLYGTTAHEDNSGSGNTSNRRAKLQSGQLSSKPYSIMLITPHGRGSSDSPGLVVNRTAADVVDEATIWFKAVSHNVPLAVQMGIIKKDNDLTWSQQLSYLHNKHGAYADRIQFNGGYHNYSGSRDDLKSTTNIVTPAYTQNPGNDGTYGSKLTSNFHNIIGKTAGTMRSAYSGISSNSGGTEYWFFTNSYTNYNTYKSTNTSILSNHGVKMKWYTATLDVKFTNGSSEIKPQSGTWSQSDLNNIFSGMYISDTTNVSLTNGVFIGKVYTDSITMYRETGVSSLTEITASTTGYDTITISGYLYWTLATTATYSNPVILGPPHTVLPRYHADSAGGTPSPITEWSFFIGDTTNSSTNTFEYDIRDTEPSGTTFNYSVTYSTKPQEINYYWKYYAYGSNIGTTYVYWYSSGTLNLLRVIVGQQHTGTTQAWLSYTEDLSSYAGQTGYIVYGYKVGTSFRQDIQFDEMSININGIITSLAPDITPGLWRRNTNYTTSLSYPSSNWDPNDIPTSTSTTYIWNLDAGGTPSGSTGGTRDASGSSTGKYLYFEGSYPNYSSSARYYWFRTKTTFTLGSS